MIRFKLDVLKELEKNGYTQKILRVDKLLSQQSIQDIRDSNKNGGVIRNIRLDTLNKICLMCRKQPGEIIEVIATDEEKIKFFNLPR